MASTALPDGRTLAYEDAGDPEGWPVFFFHGAPDSRLARHPDNELAVAAGARLITADRPGYGGSTRRPGRRLLDWAPEVAALADTLGVERLSVMGWSAGGPYALAVAHRLPDRVAAVALASSPGPPPWAPDTVKSDFRLLWRLRHVRPAIKLMVRSETKQARNHPSRYIENVWLKDTPAADREAIQVEPVRAMAEQEVAEAARQGSGGYYDDMIAITRPWGFSPAQVHQPVALWHGAADAWVYPEMAKKLAAQLADSELKLLPGEGHFLLLRNWSAILTDVVQRSS